MQNKPTDIKIAQNKFNRAFTNNDKIIAEEEATRYRKQNNKTNKTNKNNKNNKTNKTNKNNKNNKKNTQPPQKKNTYDDDNMDPFEPRKYTEDLGINIKNLFFDILEMVANGDNPMPYLMDNPKKQFVFAIMIISIGTLLLFFSNLMV